MEITLQTLLWPDNALPFPISLIPPACRFGAVALIIPVLVLLLVDVLAYVYFRIAYQPWFTRRRTCVLPVSCFVDLSTRADVILLAHRAYWTFARPTWRRQRSSSVTSSPEIGTPSGRSTALPKTAIDRRQPSGSTNDGQPGEPLKPPRRNRSWVHARTRSVGVDGPLFGFEQMRSPSPELANLPPTSDDEDEAEPEVEEFASGRSHTSDEWVRAEKNGSSD